MIFLACGTGAPAPEAPADPAVEIVHYTCPMHPSVREAENVPCPICNMDLTPVTRADLESGAVVIDSLRRQRFGVRTTEVAVRPLRREIAGVGTVKWDDTRTFDMTIRAMGWVDRLLVTETGTPVGRGQAIARVYSPDLYAAQRELIAHQDSPRAEEKRERLKNLGFEGAQIAELLQSDSADEITELRSPISGVVTELNAVNGSHLMEGALLARIARLDKVWVEASVYEDDAPFVKVGSALTVTVPGSEAKLQGEVQRVEPWVDPVTRRLVVRAQLENPDEVLLPNMYVDVAITAELGDTLTVPNEAVLYTGERELVFVDRGEDRLVPTEVQVGRRGGYWVEIADGLQAGEQVVTSGAFLVAAESRLRAAETYWGAEHEHP